MLDCHVWNSTESNHQRLFKAQLWRCHKFWFVNASPCCFPFLSRVSQEREDYSPPQLWNAWWRLQRSSHHFLNATAGGFSIERQWATQLSTLHFIYDKLKSLLISACCRVSNQGLEQHVYLAGKASWSGSQGKAPVHRDNPEYLLSLQVLRWNWECGCVYVIVQGRNCDLCAPVHRAGF